MWLPSVTELSILLHSVLNTLQINNTLCILNNIAIASPVKSQFVDSAHYEKRCADVSALKRGLYGHFHANNPQCAFLNHSFHHFPIVSPFKRRKYPSISDQLAALSLCLCCWNVLLSGALRRVRRKGTRRELPSGSEGHRTAAPWPTSCAVIRRRLNQTRNTERVERVCIEVSWQLLKRFFDNACPQSSTYWVTAVCGK